MPKLPVDYSKIIIYKIVCDDLNVLDLYIGSTTDFRKRKNQHKSVCNNVNDKGYNLKVYQMIRENGGWENWSMIEIEKFSCLNGNEARARERHWLEALSANMNIRVPSRTRKEYKKEYDKEYNEANRDKIKAYQREYYLKKKLIDINNV